MTGPLARTTREVERGRQRGRETQREEANMNQTREVLVRMVARSLVSSRFCQR